MYFWILMASPGFSFFRSLSAATNIAANDTTPIFNWWNNTVQDHICKEWKTTWTETPKFQKKSYAQFLGDSCDHKSKIWCCVGFCRKGMCVLEAHSIIFTKNLGGYRTISDAIREIVDMLKNTKKTADDSNAAHKKCIDESTEKSKIIDQNTKDIAKHVNSKKKWLGSYYNVIQGYEAKNKMLEDMNKQLANCTRSECELKDTTQELREEIIGNHKSIDALHKRIATQLTSQNKMYRKHKSLKEKIAELKEMVVEHQKNSNADIDNVVKVSNTALNATERRHLQDDDIQDYNIEDYNFLLEDDSPVYMDADDEESYYRAMEEEEQM